jgi:isoleucyl-tRNA synthetase
VLLTGWYQGLSALDAGDPFDRAFWEQVSTLRAVVGKGLEQLRGEGRIGSSLDAEVDLYCDAPLLGRLARLGDELRFVLITSAARIQAEAEAPAEATESEIPGLRLRVRPSEHPKCVRCWHHREDVGQHPSHPELCGRCVENLEGAGEARRFA